MKYKRILLKLSGESLMGERQYGIDNKRVLQYAEDIKSVFNSGIQIAVVVGGRKYFPRIKRRKIRHGKGAG